MTKLEYHRFARADSCTEEGCKAKKWYLESGRRFCDRGHEQIGFTQIAQDADDFNRQAIARVTRKKRAAKEKILTAFNGREASDLYLECYQLILWKQVYFLINSKGFPPELETVVRDLWGLRARLSYGEVEEEEGSRAGTTGFSSLSEAGSEDEMSISSKWSRRSLGRGRERLPKLVETLGLLYLGFLMLRLPISVGEVYWWARRDEIVYTRAIKEIPMEMRRRLPGHFHSALEIHSPLKGSSIYNSILELTEFYNIQVKMVFPPLNQPLLLEKHLRNLALPIEIYPAVNRLITALEMDFTFPVLQKRKHGVLAHLEVQLMCLIVVATKLCQPFDDIERYPVDDADPTVVKIDWESWSAALEDEPVEGIRRGEEIKVIDEDVLAMSDEEIDDYLDWFQRTWIDDRPAKMGEQILDFFPLNGLRPLAPVEDDQQKKMDRLKRIQEAGIVQTPLPVNEDNDVTRPGEFYKRYRTVEELPKHGRIFYEEASKAIGISLQSLVRGVFQTEVELEKWRLAQKKQQISVELESSRSSKDGNL